MPLPNDPSAVLVGVLSPVLVFVGVAVAWRGVSRTREEWRQDLMLLPWAFATALLWHPGLVRGLVGSRPGEAFPTLSGAGRLGLAGAAVVAGLAVLALSIAKTRALRDALARRAILAPAAADLAATATLALAALALGWTLLRGRYGGASSEPGTGSVLEGASGAARLRALLFPTADGAFVEHAASLFLWTTVLACLLGWLLAVRLRRRSLGALQAGAAAAALAASWSIVSLALP